MKDLGLLREEIDAIDRRLVELFEERMQIAENVARYKLANGKEVFDKERELAKLKAVRSQAQDEQNQEGIESLFHNIMAISRRRQYTLMAEQMPGYNRFVQKPQTIESLTKVVFQGVFGAYGHQAMQGYFGTNINSFCVETFKGAMEAVKHGQAEYGVLPIENSSTGMITDVYDLLEAYDNYIVGEYVVKVDHALLGLPGASIEDIQVVYSHPQGLLQCRNFLDPKGWEEISLQNTAIAAKKVVSEQNIAQAAIASELAANYHGLSILVSHINDLDNNSTRFIIIKNKPEYVPEADQISICFELEHTSGTLYNILANFIFNGLNMNKIESRPLKGRKWQYRFFIDFEGNLAWEQVRNALTGIAAETKNFRILGNYIHAQ